MDEVGKDPGSEDLTLDAESLCRLLARLDASTLPDLPAVFPGNGPQMQPLFRGPNAELVLVRWAPGQATPVGTLGLSTMAVRPVDGELELLSFALHGGGPKLVGIETIGPGQIAGIPASAVHALRARAPALSLHLCSPPVLARQEIDVASWF